MRVPTRLALLVTLVVLPIVWMTTLYGLAYERRALATARDGGMTRAGDQNSELSTHKALQGDWQSSVRVDGFLDVARGEWLTDTERLDTDPRPSPPQSLWATFDAANLYLGWRGARWGIHGAGYLYLDTQPGGTATPWQPTPNSLSLPFAADIVITVGPGASDLRRFDGAAWQPVSDPNFAVAHGAHGDTEIRAPWASLGTTAASAEVSLLAFSDDNGRIASVFPTNQSVLGPWSSAYHWANLTPATVPNAGQPSGHHAAVDITTPRGQPPLVGPGQAVSYRLAVANRDRVPLPDVALVVSAGQGLSLESIQGAPPQMPGVMWSVPLGTLPPGPSAPITVTARVTTSVTDLNTVTLQARLEAGEPSAEPTLAEDSLSLAVDNAAPTVRITLPASGATIRSGSQVAHGTASDPSGVSLVEVKVDDGPWRVPLTNLSGAPTALAWELDFDAPASGEFVIQARATDVFGQLSALQSVPVTVDNVAPSAFVGQTSAVLRGTSALLSGTARDSHPDGGDIARVDIQIDQGAWQISPPPYLPLPGIGARQWRFTWVLPREEGVEHRVQVRAIDAASNVGEPSAPLTVTVDSVAPTSTLTYPLAGATVPEACQTLPAGTILMWGTATDGWAFGGVTVSVDGGQTWSEARLGQAAAALLAETLCGAGAGAAPAATSPTTVLWAAVLPAPVGPLALRSRAVDRAGNVEPLKTPVRVQHSPAAPPAGHRLWLPIIVSEGYIRAARE